MPFPKPDTQANPPMIPTSHRLAAIAFYRLAARVWFMHTYVCYLMMFLSAHSQDTFLSFYTGSKPPSQLQTIEDSGHTATSTGEKDQLKEYVKKL